MKIRLMLAATLFALPVDAAQASTWIGARAGATYNTADGRQINTTKCATTMGME